MIKNLYPKVSIVIATYNSEKTLPLTLLSVKKQNYPKDKIEVLVIDGGSEDNTLEIAKSYSCKIIPNPKREPISAKHIGFVKASGKYMVYLDSDEVIEDSTSLKRKIEVFKSNPKIKAVIPSGYKKPEGYSPINYYINGFGDPFSFFIYNLSKDSSFFLKTLKSRYKNTHEDKNFAAFNFSKVTPLPIIELVAMSSMTDLKYLKSHFPQINKDESLVPFYFYLLNTENNLIAIMKNDPIIHYSSDTVSKYLKKISSRVKNNIYQTGMGVGGFLGRDKFQPSYFRLKRYLFIPYSFSIIFPLIDSLYLTITRQNMIFLLHPFLCIFTSCLIIYYFILKIIGLKPNIQSYGN